MADYLKTFLAKAKLLLEKKEELSEEEMEKFGKKDAEAYPLVSGGEGGGGCMGGGLSHESLTVVLKWNGSLILTPRNCQRTSTCAPLVIRSLRVLSLFVSTYSTSIWTRSMTFVLRYVVCVSVHKY